MSYIRQEDNPHLNPSLWLPEKGKVNVKLTIARLILAISALSSLFFTGLFLYLNWELFLQMVAVFVVLISFVGIPVSIMWAYDQVDEARRKRGSK